MKKDWQRQDFIPLGKIRRVVSENAFTSSAVCQYLSMSYRLPKYLREVGYGGSRLCESGYFAYHRPALCSNRPLQYGLKTFKSPVQTYSRLSECRARWSVILMISATSYRLMYEVVLGPGQPPNSRIVCPMTIISSETISLQYHQRYSQIALITASGAVTVSV